MAVHSLEVQLNEETLFTAARRVVNYFNIDMNKGGLITEETQHAVETLDKMVRKEDAKVKLQIVNKEES